MLLFNLGINILLIPRISFYGSAVAAVFSNLIMAVLYYHYSQKLYHISFEIKKVVLMFFVGFVLFGISLLTNYINIYIGMIIKLFLLFLFPLILYLFNFYEAIEIESLKGFYKKWKNPKNWKRNLIKK